MTKSGWLISMRRTPTSLAARSSASASGREKGVSFGNQLKNGSSLRKKFAFFVQNFHGNIRQLAAHLRRELHVRLRFMVLDVIDGGDRREPDDLSAQPQRHVHNVRIQTAHVAVEDYSAENLHWNIFEIVRLEWNQLRGRSVMMALDDNGAHA